MSRAARLPRCLLLIGLALQPVAAVPRQGDTVLLPSSSTSASSSTTPASYPKLERANTAEPDAHVAEASVSFLGAIVPPTCHAPTLSGHTSWTVNSSAMQMQTAHPRCYVGVAPQSAQRKLPVLIWYESTGEPEALPTHRAPCPPFACVRLPNVACPLNLRSRHGRLHGIGGNGPQCGPGSVNNKDSKGVGGLAELATGFAIVCPKALSFNGTASTEHGADGTWASNMWDIPQPMNASTGTRCGASRDYDLMLALVNDLASRPNLDTDNIYILGESLGGAAAGFWAVCLREALGSRRAAVRAFGMHSSGLKLKGDGVLMDRMPHASTETFGECEGCQFYPFVPAGDGPKACAFGSPTDYQTNGGQLLRQFATSWQGLGNTVQMRMHANPDAAPRTPDQHVYWHSYLEMVDCLDDGRGVLLPHAAAGTPALMQSRQQHVSWGVGGVWWMGESAAA